MHHLYFSLPISILVIQAAPGFCATSLENCRLGERKKAVKW
jgi:hypothetical protein